MAHACFGIKVFQFLSVVQVAIGLQARFQLVIVNHSRLMFVEKFQHGVHLYPFVKVGILIGVVSESFFLQVYQFPTIEQIQATHIGSRGELHAGIISHRSLTVGISVDGADHNHAVGRPRTVDRGSSSIFEEGDVLHDGRIDAVDVPFERNAVYYQQRFVACGSASQCSHTSYIILAILLHQSRHLSLQSRDDVGL